MAAFCVCELCRGLLVLSMLELNGLGTHNLRACGAINILARARDFLVETTAAGPAKQSEES